MNNKKRYDEMHPSGIPDTLHTISNLVPSNAVVKVAAVGIINAAGQILAGFNKKRGVWDIVQGKVEDGELPVEAIIREAKEEIGLDIEESNLESIALFKHKTPEFVFPWDTSLYLLHNTALDSVKNMEPDKCTELRWFSPNQMPYPRGLSMRVFLNLLGK